MEKLHGSCLCGAVSYETDQRPVIKGHCYCTDCRKASGTSHGSHIAVPDTDFKLTGELQFYDKPADSGNIVSRGFCQNCGSAIYSTNSGLPGMIFIRASSLDNPNAVSMAMSVYASRAPIWGQPDPTLPSFAEMPPGGPSEVLKQKQ